MSVRFDHLLVATRDKYRSARFFAEIFSLLEPEEAGFFISIRLSDGVVLSFAEPGIEFPGQHYAFLVDDVFDGILERIQACGIAYWADPQGRLLGQINTNNGEQGVYFDDPDGHHLVDEPSRRRRCCIIRYCTPAQGSTVLLRPPAVPSCAGG